MKRNNGFSFQFKMNESFYMTLPSNASMDTHPTNTMANFKTELFTPIRFERDFEVALVEITLPSIEKELLPVGNIEMVKDNGASVMIHVGINDVDGLDFSGVLQKFSKLLLFNGRNLSLASAGALGLKLMDNKNYVSIDNLAIEHSRLLIGSGNVTKLSCCIPASQEI